MKKQIQNELEHQEAYLLLSISKKEMYAVPAGYFTAKKEDLYDLGDNEYTVPENYFEQKKASLVEIMEKDVPEKALPKAKTIHLKRWISIAAAVTVFAVSIPILNTINFQNQPITQSTDFQKILNEESIFSDDEIAFLTNSSDDYFYDSFLVETASNELKNDDLEQIENGSYFDSVEYL